MLEAIAFDGDDTLWQSETAFAVTQDAVRSLLRPRVDTAEFDARLLATEAANLAHYGYGAKSYTLSLIETALDMVGDALTARDVRALLEAGKHLLAHPVELLEGAREAVTAAKSYSIPVLLVTKGDLFHQESKVARSGLGELFDGIEIVPEKDESTYRRVLRRHAVAAERFLMIGNSLRSDAAPVLSLGGWAAFVPHELTWALDRLDDERLVTESPRFRQLSSLVETADLLAELMA